MHNILTLLSPSAALPGPFALAYTAESQLARFQRLREKPGALTATDSALSAAEAHFRAQVDRTLALLDNMELCDTPPLGTFKDTLDALGCQVNPSGKSEFWRVVEAAARSSSVRRWDTRLQVEAFEATRRQWFLVFDTITYDPSRHGDEVMFGPYWRRYQRSVQHAVVRRAHGSLRRFRRSGKGFDDHVRYFAVPEAHKDGRTHVHILWFVSHLPDVASEADPNAHNPLRPRRQVDGWPLYPFGMITMRIPVRYRGDAFTTRLGWRLPLDNDGKRPILKDSVAVARYMAKYLSKPKTCEFKMSTNPHFPPAGPPVGSSNPFDPNAPAVGAPTPGSSASENQAGPVRDSPAAVPPPQPDITRNDHPVPEAPEPPLWTDEDYIRYAQGRFGHKFTAPAARAFSDFDPTSHHIQAAEFYRYSDDVFNKYGYF